MPEAVAGIDVVTLYRRTDDDVLGIVFSGMFCMYVCFLTIYEHRHSQPQSIRK